MRLPRGASRFDNVDLMLVDPDVNVRDSLRSVLHHNGFRKLSASASWSDIRSRLDNSPPDLLITEVDLSDGDVCALIRELRHQDVGTNPFLPIIALTREPTPDMVKRVINSGADFLLGKPVSADQLTSRIRLLVESRKPFVVTSNYVGPDRRRSNDRASNVPLVEVPNVLKARMTGTHPTAGTLRMVNNIASQLNLMKLERLGFQIAYLIDRIVPALEGGMPADAQAADYILQLVTITEETARRCVGTQVEHVGELCQSLLKVAGGIANQKAAPASRDVRLLQPLSDAIRRGLSEMGEAAEIARRISQEVNR